MTDKQTPEVHVFASRWRAGGFVVFFAVFIFFGFHLSQLEGDMGPRLPGVSKEIFGWFLVCLGLVSLLPNLVRLVDPRPLLEMSGKGFTYRLLGLGSFEPIPWDQITEVRLEEREPGWIGLPAWRAYLWFVIRDHAIVEQHIGRGLLDFNFFGTQGAGIRLDLLPMHEEPGTVLLWVDRARGREA